MFSRIARAAAVAGVMALPSVADAATYKLDYTTAGGNLLTALIEGTLQVDGDTVIVTSVHDAALNGVAGPLLPFVNSVTQVLRRTGPAATLTLSGLGNDFAACAQANCIQGFAFAPATIFGYVAYSSSAAYGGRTEAFNVSRYSLSAVPLPAGGFVLLSALAGLAALRKKRAA